ncbi:hypothetical protein IY145_14295 [Methylosinus sp. H3A]|uniref:DUF2946 family protein n=1 Tax=Methylosinus sp. H3A TaxID=2785786 RepID=UPI0018C2B208|nr:DUF2946 family protein [Methylosinus sp. H3A]MBG0810539.1 hypothetical protein [Methylosinus sp. H3A]
MEILRPRSSQIARAFSRGVIALLFVLQTLALLPGESRARDRSSAAAVASGEICRPSSDGVHPAHDTLDHRCRHCALCPLRCDTASSGAGLPASMLALPPARSDAASGPRPVGNAELRPVRRIVSWSSRAPPLG